MAEVVYMPKLSDTMTEGVVASWNKKIGDSVKAGESSTSSFRLSALV